MKNYNRSVEKATVPIVLDQPHWILIIGGSGSDRTNKLLNLIKYQWTDIDKTYFYVKDPFESEHQLLINGREKVGIKGWKNPEAFADYSQTTGDVYENSTKKKSVNSVWWYDRR